jgi:hypothetical protein
MNKDERIANLTRALTDAINYIEHSEAFKGAMTVAQIEALAEFNLTGARALLRTMERGYHDQA